MSQTSLNLTGVASTGALSLQSNGTTEAIGISTGQVATLAQNPVLTSGTANGVGYLNGSKVLTTGSALTFDGTNFNVVRAAATDQYMSLYADGTGPTFKFFGGAAGKIAGIVADSASASMYFTNEGNKPFVYAINGSEQMRLTSTGLGIGTSSPSYKFQVSNTSGYAQMALQGSSANGGIIRFYDSTSVVTASIFGFGSAASTDSYALRFDTNGAERARIDSSGNLGVGTTSPNASAIIDAQSTTKGVRFPNMTGTQKNAISNPPAGLVVFDTTLAKLCVYSGSAWQTITSI